MLIGPTQGNVYTSALQLRCSYIDFFLSVSFHVLRRIGDLMNEVVNKYGVVWVASAGNHGPALCTIGTPPDISQPSCIGVGAYVSPDMMEAEYAMRQKLPGNVYTWTSRDPCIDGGQGVTVCAPGAAIASVPEFTMARQQLMNGTSMAAPHVAGAVALLISGLKQKGVDYSPFSIKRALWNTANKLSYVDPFAQGNGLLNVEKAFETLVDYAEHQETKLRFVMFMLKQLDLYLIIFWFTDFLSVLVLMAVVLRESTYDAVFLNWLRSFQSQLIQSSLMIKKFLPIKKLILTYA